MKSWKTFYEFPWERGLPGKKESFKEFQKDCRNCYQIVIMWIGIIHSFKSSLLLI